MQEDYEIYIDPEEDEIFFGCISDKEKDVCAKISKYGSIKESNTSEVHLDMNSHLKNDYSEFKTNDKIGGCFDFENSSAEFTKPEPPQNTGSKTPNLKSNIQDNNDDDTITNYTNTSVELDHNYSTPMKQKIDKSILSTPKSVVKADKDGGFLKVLSEIALVKAEVEGDKKQEIEKKEDEDKENNVTYVIPEIKVTEATPEKSVISSPSRNVDKQLRRFRIIYNSPAENVGRRSVKSVVESFENNKNLKNKSVDNDFDMKDSEDKSIKDRRNSEELNKSMNLIHWNDSSMSNNIEERSEAEEKSEISVLEMKKESPDEPHLIMYLTKDKSTEKCTIEEYTHVIQDEKISHHVFKNEHILDKNLWIDTKIHKFNQLHDDHEKAPNKLDILMESSKDEEVEIFKSPSLQKKRLSGIHFIQNDKSPHEKKNTEGILSNSNGWNNRRIESKSVQSESLPEQAYLQGNNQIIATDEPPVVLNKSIGKVDKELGVFEQPSATEEKFSNNEPEIKDELFIGKKNVEKDYENRKCSELNAKVESSLLSEDVNVNKEKNQDNILASNVIVLDNFKDSSGVKSDISECPKLLPQTGIMSTEVSKVHPSIFSDGETIQLLTKPQTKIVQGVRFSREARKIVEVLKTATMDDTLNFTIPEIDLDNMENSFLSPGMDLKLDETINPNVDVQNTEKVKISPISVNRLQNVEKMHNTVNKDCSKITSHLMMECQPNETIKSNEESIHYPEKLKSSPVLTSVKRIGNVGKMANTVEKDRHKTTPGLPGSKIPPAKYFSERKFVQNRVDVKKCVKKLPIEEKRPATIEKIKGSQGIDKHPSSTVTSRIPKFEPKTSRIPFVGKVTHQVSEKSTPGKTPNKIYKNPKFNNIESPINAYINNKPTSLIQNVKSESKKDGIIKVWKTQTISSAKKIQEVKTPKVQNRNNAPELPFVEYKSATPYKVEKIPESRLPRLAPTVKKLIGTHSPRILRHEGRFYMKTPRKQVSADTTVLADANEVSVVLSQVAQKSNTIK